MVTGKPKAPLDSEWKLARSQKDAEPLLSRARGFHDAFVRNAHLDSGTYVNQELQSIEKTHASMWMLLQTQWEDTPAIELLFAEIEDVEYNSAYDRSGTIELSPNSCKVQLGGWRIEARKLYFRFGSSEDLGPRPPTLYERELPGDFTLIGE